MDLRTDFGLREIVAGGTACYRNFDEAWADLKHNYDERFYRMWKFYLLSGAASSRSRRMQLWQIVMSK